MCLAIKFTILRVIYHISLHYEPTSPKIANTTMFTLVLNENKLLVLLPADRVFWDLFIKLMIIQTTWCSQVTNIRS